MRLLNLALKPVLAGILVGAVAMISSPAPARYPQPSVYPVAWELDFRYDLPRRIVVEIPGQSAPKAYWYMTYVATNNTQQEQIFLPKFEMVTKTGEVLRSDQETSPAVFEAIARRERSKPLQPALKLAGQILVGEDQAKYGVAIWQEPEARMGSFSVFISGLSGETAPLTGADGKPMLDKDGQPILLRKTRELDFTVRGDELYAGDPIVKTNDTWVMR